jgi:DNA-directed RNA polymerase specialized sigma24 family protein
VAKTKLTENPDLKAQGSERAALVSQLVRIANLLALVSVKGESQTEKIVTLTAAGFSPAELAELLGTTANTISVTLYKSKHPTAKPSASKGTKRSGSNAPN